MKILSIDSRHSGIPGAGIVFTTAAQGLNIGENYFSAQDIEVNGAANSAAAQAGILFNGSNSSGSSAIGCISKFNNVGSGAGYGINASGSVAVGRKIVDCLVWGCKTDGIRLGNSGTIVYNNTSVGNVNGFANIGSTERLINNLAADNTTADFAVGASNAANSHNASSDTTAPGANTRKEQTFSFMNAGANNYHLSLDDEGAKGFGTDLSADASYPFDDDIDHELWDGDWSIGFDKPTAPSGGPRPGHSYQHQHSPSGWHRSWSN